jgi:hypothetical protein
MAAIPRAGKSVGKRWFQPKPFHSKQKGKDENAGKQITMMILLVAGSKDIATDWAQGLLGSTFGLEVAICVLQLVPL